MRPYKPTLSRLDRELIVEAYAQLIGEKIGEGRDAYYLNFMFNQLPGSKQIRMDTMTQEVERVHSILTHHIVRRPHAENSAHLRPILIGSHDLPVFKWEQGEPSRMDVANDGLHFNAIALVPPHRHSALPTWFQYWRRGRPSRLKVPLQQHFHERQRFYLNDRLARAHVTRITYGTMADYLLKNFKHGRLDGDSLLLLC
jgi:hypothetical protein